MNLYGPGDNFDPKSSHVIPALIKKCVDAKRAGEEEIVVWGTGKATREFFYVEDAAKAIVQAMERYDSRILSTSARGSRSPSVSSSALIVDLTGFEGRIVWDESKPDGQPRRMLDTDRAKTAFGFEATTSFRDGLKKTIDWYVKNRGTGDR